MPLKFPKRQTLLFLVFITLIFSGLYSYTFDKKLDLNGDNANYYMLGKALVSGDGYVNINSTKKTLNNHFPPGYPVINAISIKLFGDSVNSLKLVNGLFFLLTLFGLFFLITKITSSKPVIIITLLLLLVNGHFLRYSSMIMSEVPFTFFTIMAFLAFIMINFDKPVWKEPWLYITIILIGILFYIRTSGIAIIGAMILYLFINKRWQHGMVIIIAITIIALPWQLRSYNLGGSSYLKQIKQINPYRPEMGMADFSDFTDRFRSNVGRYITKEIPATIFSFYKPVYKEASTPLQWLIGLMLVTLIFFGIWQLKTYSSFILAYTGATLAILFLWPGVWFGIRFILPATPFLILGLVNGLKQLMEKYVGQNASKKLQWVPILLVIPFLIKLKPIHDLAAAGLQPNWENYFGLAKWVNSNIEHDAVIACRKPTMFYLYSNTFTVKYKYAEDPEELIKDLLAKEVDYVVMEQLGYSSTYRYLIPAVRNNMDRFEVIKHFDYPDTFLVRLKK